MTELSASLMPLRAKFIASILPRLAELETLRRQVAADAAGMQALTEIGHVAHRISGVAATLGFARAGELASEVDRQATAVRSGQELFAWAWPRTEPVLEALMDELEAQLD